MPQQAAPQRPVILAVDDAADLLALMAKALSADYKVLTAEDGASGLKLALGKPRPDLILLDVEMPGLSGFELCKMLKANHETADIPVIFLTGKTERQAEVEGLQLGAVDYVTKPINSAVLKARVRAHVALSNQRSELERLVQERTAQLESTRVELIQRLGRAMQFHESSAVGNRVLRLGHYARLISQAAGAKPAICDMMLKAAPLHDVGKLGVPSEVLRKKEKLSAPDLEQMKRHPQLGADIIGEQRDPLMQLARQLALTHHEHWDGSGYPKRLKGEAIPWPGRVMAVVDAFEAMTTTQFYRDTPLPVEQAAAEIVQQSGKHFDPAVVKAFQKALPAMKKVHEAYADALGDVINLDFSKPRRGAQAPAPIPEITFSAPAAESGEAQAQEARLKALEAASAQKIAAAEKKVEELAAQLALATKAAPSALDPALEEKLRRETEARVAAEAKVKELQASLGEERKAEEALRQRAEGRAGESAEAREKLVAAEAERRRLEAALADALQNLETERKLGELGVADAKLERQRLENALKQEAEMRAEGERRATEMAAVRKRIDTALNDARDKLVAAEEKLARETSARLEAQRALDAAQAKLEQEGSARLADAAAERERLERALAEARARTATTEETLKRERAGLDKELAEARAQKLAAEASAKREAAARIEGDERRTHEMAEVRKRIDAALGEARDRLALSERRLKEESDARAAAAAERERLAAALTQAEAQRKAAEEQLKQAGARVAAEHGAADAAVRKRMDAALEIGKREAQALDETRKRLAAAEKQLKETSAAHAAAEQKARQESQARLAAMEIGKREAQALDEARKRVKELERQLAEARAPEKKPEPPAEPPSPDNSGGISRQGLVAARRSLGKLREKSGK